MQGETQKTIALFQIVKDTKFESNSQHDSIRAFNEQLFQIVKDTKFESNSQLA